MKQKHYPSSRAVRVGTALVGSTLCVGSVAIAQNAASSSERLEEVVVTGTRIAREFTDASTPLMVIGADEIRLSGSMNVEKVLSEQPQFVSATNGGATANTVPAGAAAGAAYTNLRGFGPTRNLVLVNGRRFAIFGPEQVTDLNTIPAALVERTEIVTGGSSAVYGSDAITGVINFIMKDDFQGVKFGAQYNTDSATSTPTYDLNLTVGGNFADDKGNAVLSLNYFKRDGFTRKDRGGWATLPLGDGCVTRDSWSDSRAGTPIPGVSATNCAAAGGKMGLVFSGSGDIPNGRFTLTPGQLSTPAIASALTAAGLAGMGSNGFTFDDAGNTARLTQRPADDFNLTLHNYLQVPQERWMLNTFADYEFTSQAEGYLEFHFSNNQVDQQLTQGNIGGAFLLNTNNPYLDPEMREVLRQMDIAETGPANIVTGPVTRVNNPNDGFAAMNLGRRMVELPFRHNIDDHNVWRTALGVRGDVGSVSESYLRDLKYDVYYTYSRSEDTSRQVGAFSRSRFAAGLLSSGNAPPVLNIFGQNISEDGVNAVKINATNVTNAEQHVAAATLGGEAFDLPAGPLGFSIGVEYRSAEAEYIPDEFLRSGDVVGFNPGLPTEGDVSVNEIFGEVRVPILADLPFMQGLTANGAYRSSDYNLDGVGRVSTYLYGLDWRVNTTVAFRGQFQRAIRAPNIGDLYGGLQLNFITATDPCSDRGTAASRTPAVRQLCIDTGVPAAAVFTRGAQPDGIIPARSGGNPELQEESSDTTTLGVVFTPSFVPSLLVTLDYFDITLDDAIAQLGGGLQNTLNLCYLTIQDANSDFCRAIHRNTGTGAISVPDVAEIRQANIGGLETSGFDLLGQYRFDMDWGGIGDSGGSSFEISTAWTYTDEFTVTPMQAVSTNQNHCEGSFGATCGEPIPEYKGTTRVTWNTGPLGLSLRHRYIDDVTTDRIVLPQRNGLAPPARNTLTNPTLPSQNYLDLSFTFDLGEKIQFYGGVNNIFDEDPPIMGAGQGYANTWPATYDYGGVTMFLGASIQSF